ncbi:hypothetical protein C8Q73DRAFT_788691 [Cubamyces lactineus]|nr:hypothetical protein C8Q73DRAFT_788691 [Cubamyces lactineus]
MFVFRLLSLVLAFFTIVPILAKPTSLIHRDSVSPPITYPTAGTVWKVGQTETIIWDVAALNGVQPSNPQGNILLGVLYANGTERLEYKTPLASGFPILGGNVSLTVPSVTTGENYIVCCASNAAPFFEFVSTAC